MHTPTLKTTQLFKEEYGCNKGHLLAGTLHCQCIRTTPSDSKGMFRWVYLQTIAAIIYNLITQAEHSKLENVTHFLDSTKLYNR